MASELLRIDDFSYDTEVTVYPTESILSYYPGGFHPVTMGTIISSAKTRYHVVHKLGHGGYATVWLVQDLSSYAWLALRIRMAQCDCAGETEVLDFIRSTLRYAFLPTIFDTFTIDGPNGRHAVIVTDLVAPLDATLAHVPEERIGAKAIAREIVEAVTQLHSAGVVHGDLHVRNIGLAMDLRKGKIKPASPLRCPVRVEPRVTLVIAETSRALAQSAHFPPYVVSAIDLGPHYEDYRDATDPHVVKLFDFGNAHLTNKPRPTSGFMTSIAPPEWMIAQTLGQKLEVVFTSASDVWALGLLMFHLMSGGRYLLPRHGWQLLEIVKLAGIIPSSWKTYPVTKKFKTHDISPASANRLWQQHQTTLRESGLSNEDASALISLLRKILVLEPSARPSAAQILRDPWFSTVSKVANQAGMQGATTLTTHSVNSTPNYAHQSPSVPPPSTNPYGMAQTVVYQNPYDSTFAPQPPHYYQHPPSVHPTSHGYYPSHPSVAYTHRLPPFPPAQFPMGSGSGLPHAPGMNS
ncbi:unnamed protein product [Peniophora sp. CBMAI 1063]|nr:unnamed protein product [Peniophora sp. CBMAI 1063]